MNPRPTKNYFLASLVPVLLRWSRGDTEEVRADNFYYTHRSWGVGVTARKAMRKHHVGQEAGDRNKGRDSSLAFISISMKRKGRAG